MASCFVCSVKINSLPGKNKNKVKKRGKKEKEEKTHRKLTLPGALGQADWGTAMGDAGAEAGGGFPKPTMKTQGFLHLPSRLLDPVDWLMFFVKLHLFFISLSICVQLPKARG